MTRLRLLIGYLAALGYCTFAETQNHSLMISIDPCFLLVNIFSITPANKLIEQNKTSKRTVNNKLSFLQVISMFNVKQQIIKRKQTK